MSTTLIFIYVILFLSNCYKVLSNKKSKTLFAFSMIYLLFLMCGHKYIGNGDARDFYGYRIGYEEFSLDNVRDYSFYYLFYTTQLIGIKLSLSFYQWWAIMTAISLALIAGTIKSLNLIHTIF